MVIVPIEIISLSRHLGTNPRMLIYAIFNSLTSQQGMGAWRDLAYKLQIAENKFRDMYCPVYGCNSDSKNNPEKKIHFFAFPKPVNKEEKKRWRKWVDFCKRKNFTPSKYTGLCSLHFNNDAYIQAHSPEFLSSINFAGRVKLLLKPDAVPTINIQLDSHVTQTKERPRGILSRKKVCTLD